MAKKQTIETVEKQIMQTQTEIPEVQIKEGILRKLGSKKIALAILIFIAVAGTLGSYYFYKKYSALKTDPNIEAKKQTDMYVAALGKLMLLPEGETPTIATISDKEKLKDQPFFKAAENGDKLFAYNTAMKAILYRPKTNKIINVAPININQPQDSTGAIQKSTTTPVPKK